MMINNAEPRPLHPSNAKPCLIEQQKKQISPAMMMIVGIEC